MRNIMKKIASDILQKVWINPTKDYNVALSEESILYYSVSKGRQLFEMGSLRNTNIDTPYTTNIFDR